MTIVEKISRAIAFLIILCTAIFFAVNNVCSFIVELLGVSLVAVSYFRDDGICSNKIFPVIFESTFAIIHTGWFIYFFTDYRYLIYDYIEYLTSDSTVISLTFILLACLYYISVSVIFLVLERALICAYEYHFDGFELDLEFDKNDYGLLIYPLKFCGFGICIAVAVFYITAVLLSIILTEFNAIIWGTFILGFVLWAFFFRSRDYNLSKENVIVSIDFLFLLLYAVYIQIVAFDYTFFIGDDEDRCFYWWTLDDLAYYVFFLFFLFVPLLAFFFGQLYHRLIDCKLEFNKEDYGVLIYIFRILIILITVILFFGSCGTVAEYKLWITGFLMVGLFTLGGGCLAKSDTMRTIGKVYIFLFFLPTVGVNLYFFYIDRDNLLLLLWAIVAQTLFSSLFRFLEKTKLWEEMSDNTKYYCRISLWVLSFISTTISNFCLCFTAYCLLHGCFFHVHSEIYEVFVCCVRQCTGIIDNLLNESEALSLNDIYIYVILGLLIFIILDIYMWIYMIKLLYVSLRMLTPKLYIFIHKRKTLYLRSFSSDDNKVATFLDAIHITDPSNTDNFSFDGIYVSDSKWKPMVLYAAKVCKRVIIKIGCTAGVLWELNELNKYNDKTFYFIDDKNVVLDLLENHTQHVHIELLQLLQYLNPKLRDGALCIFKKEKDSNSFKYLIFRDLMSISRKIEDECQKEWSYYIINEDTRVSHKC